MKFKLSLILAMAFLISGCGGTSKSFIELNQEPKNYAWWLRISFNPQGKVILGIPIKNIEKTWCEANEYSEQIFPEEVKLGGESHLNTIMKNESLSFALRLVPENGRNYRVSLVAFKKCNGEVGTAILYTLVEENKFRFAHVTEIANQATFAIFRPVSNSEFQVWFCYSCGTTSTYKWEKNTSSFIESE